MPTTPRISRSNDRLYQDIVDHIQEMIVSGRLAAGDQLPSERQLANQFDVSRTAVREAIRALTEKGLVEIRLGRGSFVTVPSVEHVAESITLLFRVDNQATNADLLAARELLEVPIAGLAAQNRTEANIQRMKELLQTMRERVGKPFEFNEADTEFHAELARASGNPVLSVLIQSLIPHVMGSARDMATYKDEHTIAGDLHEAILRQVERGNVQAAERAMKRHLEHVEHVFHDLGLISKRIGPSPDVPQDAMKLSSPPE